MIPEPHATLEGAATWRIQWHVIPEPRVTLQGAATLWIHCHDPRSTCHIAGCSHLAKSVSWSCHIAGCKNSIRHIENCFSPYFIIFCFLNAVLALTSGGFRIVSDTLVSANFVGRLVKIKLDKANVIHVLCKQLWACGVLSVLSRPPSIGNRPCLKFLGGKFEVWGGGNSPPQMCLDKTLGVL